MSVSGQAINNALHSRVCLKCALPVSASADTGGGRSVAKKAFSMSILVLVVTLTDDLISPLCFLAEHAMAKKTKSATAIFKVRPPPPRYRRRYLVFSIILWLSLLLLVFAGGFWLHRIERRASEERNTRETLHAHQRRSTFASNVTRDLFNNSDLAIYIDPERSSMVLSALEGAAEDFEDNVIENLPVSTKYNHYEFGYLNATFYVASLCYGIQLDGVGLAASAGRRFAIILSPIGNLVYVLCVYITSKLIYKHVTRTFKPGTRRRVIVCDRIFRVLMCAVLLLIVILLVLLIVAFRNRHIYWQDTLMVTFVKDQAEKKLPLFSGVCSSIDTS